MDPALESRFHAAIGFARDAGRLVLTAFQSGTARAQIKPDNTPVTDADRAAELLLRTAILARYPDDSILGEELGTTPGRSPWGWVLDPIDGTASFIHGVPLFGTIIGLTFEGTPVAGVIELPALSERLAAATGTGTLHWKPGAADPSPARVRASRPLAVSTLCTTGPEYFRRAGCAALWHDLSVSAGLLRGWSDCYAAVLLATGRIDALVEPLVKPWDVFGLWPIVREAGGVITDCRGRDDPRAGSMIASTGGSHAELLTLARRHLPVPD